MIMAFPRPNYNKVIRLLLIVLVVITMLRVFASCADEDDFVCPNMADCAGEVYGGGPCNCCDE